MHPQDDDGKRPDDERKPYTKPLILEEATFEAQALSCAPTSDSFCGKNAS